MEEYIRFRETSNWESEVWRFYIPLRGNEIAIRELADALRRLEPVGGCFIGEHIQYDIRLMPFSEDEVDRLRESGRGGYMSWHNKLEGRLDIRAVRRAVRLLAKNQDDLYKGGITRMMRPWRRRPATADWPTGRIRAALCRTPISEWGDRLSNRFDGVRLYKQLSGRERCWLARERLREAGFRTVGDVAGLTAKKLLGKPDIGRTTVELTRWMLRDIGLDFRT